MSDQPEPRAAGVRFNQLGQPIRQSVGEWKPPPPPPRAPMIGRYCSLEPLEAHHGHGLWEAYARDTDHRNWTYRRYEWKPDALNAASRAAAERLGLTCEGTFRQATVYKGRNRDSAWYAAIDKEWPALRAAFERWLEPENFDAEGRQRSRLGSAKTRNTAEARKHEL